MLNLHPKVQNPAFAGAVTVLVVWLTKIMLHQDVPGEVASAVTVLVMALTGYSSKAE